MQAEEGPLAFGWKKLSHHKSVMDTAQELSRGVEVDRSRSGWVGYRQGTVDEGGRVWVGPYPAIDMLVCKKLATALMILSEKRSRHTSISFR